MRRKKEASIHVPWQSPAQNRPKRQHYVPRVLLKSFCAPNSRHLWVFDKLTERVWSGSINDVGHETRFNEAPLGNRWFVRYEDKFARVETKTAPVLSKLCSGATIPSLSVMDFCQLSFFVAVQFLRTPAQFSRLRQLNEELRRLFPDGHVPLTIRKQVGPLTDDAAKFFSLDSLFPMAEKIAQLLVQKVWIVHSAHPTKSFYIGDSPVALHNQVQDDLRSTIGFAVPGIEIYMPISATALAAAYCPMLFQHLGEQEQYRTAQETGEPIACLSTHMEFYNSLQVAYAERFVYCRDNDFDLARRIVQQHPNLRNPRRLASNVPVGRAGSLG